MMRTTQILTMLFNNPGEVRTLASYWMFHRPNRDITAPHEHATSGYDRRTMRRCWEFLDKTSRSFAIVIKQLDGDLARIICIFYLVLRALDTIEDDMSLSDLVKQDLLRSFHLKLHTKGWTFDGCSPQEKDRQLLVEFDNVIAELALLDSACQTVITDICLKMQTGMAQFAHKASTSTTPSIYLDTIPEYDLYCHYVAGLVGEGLSRLFCSCGVEPASSLRRQLEHSNSMGLLLHKAHILRDFRQDVDERRFFWPKEIWRRYGFQTPVDMIDEESQEGKAGGSREERALYALSEVNLNALEHAVDSLEYLALITNASVFHFVAVPASVAMATLAGCFMNPEVLERSIKPSKGQVVKLMMRAKDMRSVAFIFREYATTIQSKATPSDPNFLRLCVVCGQIDAWVETRFPSSSRLPPPPSSLQPLQLPIHAGSDTAPLLRLSEKDQLQLGLSSLPSTNKTANPFLHLARQLSLPIFLPLLLLLLISIRFLDI